MKYPGILGDKYARQLYPGGKIPLRVLTVLVAMSVNVSVQRVRLNSLLAGQLHNRRMHMDESYRSPPNSGFSCKITPVDIFYVQKHDIVIRSGVSDVNLVCITPK